MTLLNQSHTATEVESPPEKIWRRWVGYALGLMVSALFLYLTLRGIDFAELRQELQSARYLPLALALVVSSATCVVRAIRWRALFGQRTQTSLRFLFTSMMIGYLANNILPARAGELVRIY